MTTQSTSTTFLDIGHTQVAYECIGEGPDVLFLHGWPLHRETWRPIVQGLDGYRCHLIDLPGAGQSLATNNTPLTLNGLIESIGRILDLLDLDEVHLVGNDSGGMFARFAAAEQPERVASLIITGSEIPGHHSWQVALYALLAKLPGGSNILKLTLSNDTLARSPLALGGCFFDTDAMSERFTSMIGDLFVDEDVLASQMTLVRNFDNAVVDTLETCHARLTMPTLLIWGEDDPFFPLKKAKAMVPQFGGPTTFLVVPEAKLLVHEEHPAHFAELTQSFLADLCQ